MNEKPPLPSMPHEISDWKKPAGVVTQTWVKVMWVIADQHGKVLRFHQEETLVCVSDDGSTIMHSPVF